MSLVPCPTCKRHVRLDETACPFCANAPIGGFLAIAAAAALALAGCGGKSAPAPQDPPGNDDPVDEPAPDAGVTDPEPPDRGGDVQPEYGVDIY